MARITIPIEEVRIGDRVNGKEVVNLLHRGHADYVRATLVGGWPILDGYWGEKVTVERTKE